MRRINKLTTDQLRQFAQIVTAAYPGLMEQTESFKENMINMLDDIQKKRTDNRSVWIVFR